MWTAIARENASCACFAACNGQSLEVQCSPISGGLACECFDNMVAIDKCQQTTANACSVSAGCCADAFFGH